jgi:hypothetical protein
VTGPAGPTGATGTFPETASTGTVEHGYWSVSTPDNATTGRLSVAQISFPITLKAALASTNTVYVSVEAEKVPGKCEGTVASPSAKPGYLCVYAGLESNNESEFKGFQNAKGEAGASPQGTEVTFEPTADGTETRVVDQGTWAVTAP